MSPYRLLVIASRLDKLGVHFVCFFVVIMQPWSCYAVFAISIFVQSLTIILY